MLGRLPEDGVAEDGVRPPDRYAELGGRWHDPDQATQRAPEILTALGSGTNVIIFNYSYSGAANYVVKVSIIVC